MPRAVSATTAAATSGSRERRRSRSFGPDLVLADRKVRLCVCLPEARPQAWLLAEVLLEQRAGLGPEVGAEFVGVVAFLDQDEAGLAEDREVVMRR